MKTIKFMLAVIITCFAFSTSTQAQVKKMSPYPNFSISPTGGIAFPVGKLGENFKSGGNFGMDFSYRVNREVGFYAKFGYYFLPNKTEGVTDAKIIEATVGPRYYFTSKNLKSAFFLEAGVGVYNFKQDSYTIPGIVPATVAAEFSETKFGVNAGMGAVLNLSKPVDLIFKVKYHNILTKDGSSSFVSPVFGIDFRL